MTSSPWGALIDQNSYAKGGGIQVAFGDNKVRLRSGRGWRSGGLRVKKSSRAEQSARLQLAHYL